MPDDSQYNEKQNSPSCYSLMQSHLAKTAYIIQLPAASHTQQ